MSLSAGNRRLKKFGISKKTMIQFYRAIVESVLTFSMTVWYGAVSHRDRARLNKIVSTASKIIGSELPSLDCLYHQRVLRRGSQLIADQTHPANKLFQKLPSGRRFRSIRTKTSRFSSSFYPKAVQILSN